MHNLSLHRLATRARKLWITEALLIAAILAFGGFALLSDDRISPAGLRTGIADFVSR